MKTLIFMNDQLKAKPPKHGVMTIQQGDLIINVDEIDLKFVDHQPTVVHQRDKAAVLARRFRVCFDSGGCKDIRSHDVVAWIEAE